MIHDIVLIAYSLFTGLPLLLGLLFAIAAIITKNYNYAFTTLFLTLFAIAAYGLVSLFLVYICSLFWSLCAFYTFARNTLRERCKCLVSTPRYRKTGKNQVKVRPKDSKLIIFLNKGIVTLHSQSYHANSTYPVTIAGGLTIFCLCKGIPKNLSFHFGHHFLTEVNTTRPKTKFLILYKSEDGTARRVQPLTLIAYCLVATYQHKLENLLIFEHPSIPFWLHKFELPLHRGHVELVSCNDDSRWVTKRCEERRHCFTYHNDKAYITN
jgi:hypothetical protein